MNRANALSLEQAGFPTEELKRLAMELGFDACGVAAAQPIDPEDLLGAWLARGFQADMHWMAATKSLRQDIQQVLPGARSVIVVARNYYAPRPEPVAKAVRVARYAWGRDYHRVLRKPLRRLARLIEESAPGGRCYCSVDSGPVLEKFWAARAGVGWIGKNGLVLRADLGSWIFLGAILTTVELAPDPPIPDRCGACTACIDACPTKAIVEPRMIDSRLCISYHTVENRGDVSDDLRPRFSRWVFGCDICQEVCPWNRGIPVTTEQDFHPRRGQANPDPDALAGLSEEEFKATFAGTPVARAGYKSMFRNVRIAQENRPLSPQ